MLLTWLPQTASLEFLPHLPQGCGRCPCALSLEAKNTASYKCYHTAGAFLSPYEIPPWGLCYHPASASTCCLGLTGPWNQYLLGASSNPILPPDRSSPVRAGGRLSCVPSEGSASVLIPLFRGSPGLARGGSQCPPPQSPVPIVTSPSRSLAFELCCISPS